MPVVSERTIYYPQPAPAGRQGWTVSTALPGTLPVGAQSSSQARLVTLPSPCAWDEALPTHPLGMPTLLSLLRLFADLDRESCHTVVSVKSVRLNILPSIALLFCLGLCSLSW